MNISMISFSKFCRYLFPVLFFIGFSYGQTTPQEVLAGAKSFTIVVDVFSGRVNPVFKLDDSVSVKAITNRLSMIMANVDKLKSDGCVQASILGYRGMIVNISDSIHQITVNVYNGKISLSPSPISAYRYCVSDSGREFERLVAKFGAKNKLSSINDTPVLFTDVVPGELYQPVTSSGVITMEVVSPDSFAIDFSPIKSQYGILKSLRSGYDPVFPDILIFNTTWASYSYNVYTIDSSYGIAEVDSVEKTAGRPFPVSSNFIQSRDSLLRYFLPVIDSTRKTFNKLQYGSSKEIRGNVYPRAYMIKTSEGGLVFLANVGMYMGGIDRIYLFWIYTDQSSFDMNALRNLTGLPARIDYCTINYLSKTYSLFPELFNLKGQTLRKSSSGTMERSLPTGVFLKKNISGNGRCEVLIRK